MSQKLFITAIYLIATISIFLVICEATSPVENRATSPARIRTKKPPFNGSMFGKRSLTPALSRPSYVTKSMEYINLDRRDEDEENEYSGSPIENLTLKMTQDEPLIQASIDQCVQIQRSSESDRDPLLATLCSNLLGNRVRENNLWIKQLLGLDRFYQ